MTKETVNQGAAAPEQHKTPEELQQSTLECLERLQQELDKARKMLNNKGKTTSGKDRFNLEEAKKEFGDFAKEFGEFKESVERQPHQKDTWLDSIKIFGEAQLKKFEKTFQVPLNAVKNNPILQAVYKVIKSVCKACVTMVQGTLNNAIAIGEVAKNVVNLGNAIAKTFGRRPHQAGMGMA